MLDGKQRSGQPSSAMSGGSTRANTGRAGKVGWVMRPFAVVHDGDEPLRAGWGTGALSFIYDAPDPGHVSSYR